MAGTSGIINGTDLRIYYGSPATAIAYATSCTLDVTREIRETLSKDTPGAGWRTISVGRKQATLSTEGLVSDVGDSTANNQVYDIFTLLDNGTEVTLRFTTDNNGDTYLQANGYATAISINAPVEENSTFSVTFEITGAMSSGTES